MKVPYTWLKELVKTNKPLEVISEALTISGFEVESIEDFSKRAEGVVIGYIERKEKHPEADKLSICHVNIGEGQVSQIVCGANNVREKTHVLVATPGAYLSSKDLKIKVSQLRGVESSGMICSLEELGFNSDCDGIAILEDMDIEIPIIGTSAQDLFELNETVLDLAITANRPDGMSMAGIAREVSALTEGELNIPTIDREQDIEFFNSIQIDKNSIESNGIYTVTRIDNLDGGKTSPNWIVKRLQSSGIKTINAIVDITNYVMLEQGQPLHAFDIDRLEKITSKEVDENSFGIRKGVKGESLLGLDGNGYKIDENITLITCHGNPIAIAGVIGSQESAVNQLTTRVFIEAALFTPTSVRNSSRSTGIRTEACIRFEKGISVEITLPSLCRYLDIISSIFDAKISNTFCDKKILNEEKQILLRRDRLNKVLGKISVNSSKDIHNLSKIDTFNYHYIKDKDIQLKLKLLGCNYQKDEKGWLVNIPPYRNLDLIREIDLIEEIARLIGYDKFDFNLPIPLNPGGLNKYQLAERSLRSSLVASGFQEITTLSLVSAKKGSTEQVPLSNPLLLETSHLRTNFWEEHIKISSRNIASGIKACWIFEIGNVYYKENNEIIETAILGGSINGNRNVGSWIEGGKIDQLNYYEARGLLHKSLLPLRIEISDKPLTNDKLLHPGRAASLVLEGKVVGRFGQIHPSLAKDFDLPSETYLFEIKIKPIIEAATRKVNWKPVFKQFPTVPFMERDIALVVAKECTSEEITSIIKKTGKPLLESVELIDRYEGDNLEEGKVSQAFRIRYRDKKNTLQDEDINPTHNRIREALSKKLGAKLRS